jgi:phage shock protein E
MEKGRSMRNYIRRTPSIYILLIILTAFQMNPALADGGEQDPAKQAWSMIESGALLVDVRTVKEFEDGHIENAINIPFNETSNLMTAIGFDKRRPVVVYCRSGNRSGKAKSELDKRGYTNVFNGMGYEALREAKP